MWLEEKRQKIVRFHLIFQFFPFLFGQKIAFTIPNYCWNVFIWGWEMKGCFRLFYPSSWKWINLLQLLLQVIHLERTRVFLQLRTEKVHFNGKQGSALKVVVVLWPRRWGERSVGVERVGKGTRDKLSPFSSVLRARQETWDEVRQDEG